MWTVKPINFRLSDLPKVHGKTWPCLGYQFFGWVSSCPVILEDADRTLGSTCPCISIVMFPRGDTSLCGVPALVIVFTNLWPLLFTLQVWIQAVSTFALSAYFPCAVDHKWVRQSELRAGPRCLWFCVQAWLSRCFFMSPGNRPYSASSSRGISVCLISTYWGNEWISGREVAAVLA